VRRNANFENNDEMIMIKRLFLLWIATTAALWVADGVFDSVRFKTLESLILSGFLLALVNQTVKPLLLLVTLPITRRSSLFCSLSRYRSPCCHLGLHCP